MSVRELRRVRIYGGKVAHLVAEQEDARANGEALCGKFIHYSDFARNIATVDCQQCGIVKARLERGLTRQPVKR